MSIVNELAVLEESFDKQNNYDMAFAGECLFAKQQIVKNEFTMKTAENNQSDGA